jgi:uncharacterized metal-binding protein
MGEEKSQMRTHENVIFSCYGGFSNTGITSALACLEVVKELGLEKVCVGCLSALPLGIEGVIKKTKAAKKVITVDGCGAQCAKKILENAGFKVTKSIVLERDIGMKKKALNEDIGGDLKGVMEYISEEDIKRAKELIIKTLLE